MPGNYNSIGRPEYGNIPQRVFDMDQASAVSTLAPDLTASVGLFDRPEWLAHAGIRLAIAGDVQAGGGAQAANFRIRNPDASGMVTVVECVETVSETLAALVLRLSQVSTDLANSVTPMPRDVRWPFNTGLGTGPGPTKVSRTNAAAIQGNKLADVSRVANTPWEYRYPIILVPGWALNVGHDNVANPLHVTFTFYERPIGAKELTIG